MLAPSSVVVGGSGVIGRAICARLPGVVYNLDRVAHQAAPRQIKWIECDVMGQVSTMRRAFPRQIRWLVYAVGGPDVGARSVSRWDAGPWFVTLERHLACAAIATGEALRRGMEAVVYLGSVYGSVGPDDRLSDHDAPSPAYCAAKAGLQGLVRWLAANGIRANVVSPTGVTGAIRAGKAFERRLKAQTPLRRLVTPSEVAEAVLFCLQHPHLSGQEILLDGGWTAR